MQQKEMIESYATSAGILSAIVRGFLLKDYDKTTCAKVFVETVEEKNTSENFPLEILELKDKVKEKYNL